MDERIFQILSASLFTDEDIEIKDWYSVFIEMKYQSVAALPAVWLKKHPIPEAAVWNNYCTVQQGQWIRIMYGQDQLLNLLDQNKIPCVIIKGTAAAMAYPHPMLRTMGDVDLLVKRVDFERAAILLESKGYKLIHEKNIAGHHYGYSKDRISFELHRRLAIIQDSDEELLSLFERGIDNREYRKVGGFSFPVLPDHLNGLVLLFHIDQHLRTGLGLRQIIDWMMYIDKLPEDIWANKVLPVLRKTETEKLALTVTATCQKYLGLKTIVEDVDNLPCDELMNYIFENGNFGQKQSVAEKVAFLSFLIADKKSLFHRLQTGGLTHWKAAKKYKVLKPFAWLYQAFRYVRILKKNNVKKKEISLQTKKGLEQRKLIEMLGLRIDRDIL